MDTESLRASIGRLAALVDRLRPTVAADVEQASERAAAELGRLAANPDEARVLGDDVAALLGLPGQAGFYAETGVRSAAGFWLEVVQRAGRRLLPPAQRPDRLGDALDAVFRVPTDHVWACALPDALWAALAHALGLDRRLQGERALAATANLHEAMRMLSYRLAGNGLDRELLRADPALERDGSPFLAQNAGLVPLLERARDAGAALDAAGLRRVDAALDACVSALERIRRRSADDGVSIRLTYLVARQRQLVQRLRVLIGAERADDRPGAWISLFKTLLRAARTRLAILSFAGENVSLLARNVTEHASRHGEHYVAQDRAQWWRMARGAAGGGVVIALMATIKIQLAGLHLPPLTEALVFGLNYGLGFVAIHLLGFTVATKQPAMTAASIAATLEETHPDDLRGLVEYAHDVVRTQFVAVLGNVGLALPVACAIALAWPALFAVPVAPPSKAAHMLDEVHPFASAALVYAAVAGVGLFLSGLVSGVFDNQARYHRLAERFAAAPAVARLGRARAERLARGLDEHYGAVLGNLFFGLYLGLVGASGALTGVPLDIRHVAFSSANLGTAAVVLGAREAATALFWGAAGTLGIALVNLAVSFSLALYVAMKSRRAGMAQIASLARQLGARFLRRPFTFFRMPDRR